MTKGMRSMVAVVAMVSVIAELAEAWSLLVLLSLLSPGNYPEDRIAAFPPHFEAVIKFKE